MTEIAAIGAVNAGIVRDSVQNEEQQFAKQQAQIKGEAEEFAQRRVVAERVGQHGDATVGHAHAALQAEG